MNCCISNTCKLVSSSLIDDLDTTLQYMSCTQWITNSLDVTISHHWECRTYITICSRIAHHLRSSTAVLFLHWYHLYISIVSQPTHRLSRLQICFSSRPIWLLALQEDEMNIRWPETERLYLLNWPYHLYIHFLFTLLIDSSLFWALGVPHLNTDCTQQKLEWSLYTTE